MTFTESVQLEMDLRFEAAAASELAGNFAGDPTFRVPQVDWRRTGRTVLTTERISGIRVDDRDGLIAAGHSIPDLLQNAAASFFNQVFRDGFFHADLHPGNVFVDAEGALAVVDFGIMGRLDRATRYYLADMLIGFLTGDYRRVAEVHFEAGYVPRRRSIDAFTQACRSIGEPILDLPLHEISIAKLLAQLFQVTEQFEMETQPQLLLLQKTMVLVEGIGRQLDPSVNIWTLARPIVEQWMRENRGPEAQLRSQIDTLIDALQEVPRVLRGLDRIVADLSREGLKLHAESIAAQASHWARLLMLLVVPLWLAGLALVALALAAIFRLRRRAGAGAALRSRCRGPRRREPRPPAQRQWTPLPGVADFRQRLQLILRHVDDGVIGIAAIRVARIATVRRRGRSNRAFGRGRRDRRAGTLIDVRVRRNRPLAVCGAGRAIHGGAVRRCRRRGARHAGSVGTRPAGDGAIDRLVDPLHLIERNRRIVLADAEEAADPDDHGGDPAIAADDHLVDVADLLVASDHRR